MKYIQRKKKAIEIPRWLRVNIIKEYAGDAYYQPHINKRNIVREYWDRRLDEIECKLSERGYALDPTRGWKIPHYVRRSVGDHSIDERDC